MIVHAIERLAPQVGSLIINANRNADIYRRLRLPRRGRRSQSAE